MKKHVICLEKEKGLVLSSSTCCFGSPKCVLGI